MKRIRRIRLSESAKRNLFLLPGVALLAGVMMVDSCSSKTARTPSKSPEALLSERVDDAPALVTVKR